MSDLQPINEDFVNDVDVEECGNSLRVASNTPHLISLGCGRLSTAVTIHPIRQGRVTLGSDTGSDIILQGTGVQPEHCRIENSNGVITLYPVSGTTCVDGIVAEKPVRLAQGCMIGIGRSNYLRFNHPEEANLMKSVLPNTRISMAPIQFFPNDSYDISQKQHNSHPVNQNYSSNDANTMHIVSNQSNENYEKLINSLNTFKGHEALDSELDMINKDIGKRKPPVAPRRMFRDLDQISNSSSSDQEAIVPIKGDTPPKTGSIMSKVSKFEYYVKNSQRNTKNTSNGEVWSPKVFSANSLTVNTPAKDVLIGKNMPSNYTNRNAQLPPQNNIDRGNGNYVNGQRTIILNENKAVDARNCSYTNVTIKSQVGKIDEISKTFDGSRNMINNSQQYFHNKQNPAKTNFRIQTPSPSFNRNPIFNSPTSPEDPQFSNISPEVQKKQFLSSNEDNQRSLEQARIDEILNMCAEYEKQNSMGYPTTPTEKKMHNKIITNGSLPRGFQNNPNIVQSSDGYYRIENSHHQSNSPRVLHSPNVSNSPLSAYNLTPNNENYISHNKINNSMTPPSPNRGAQFQYSSGNMKVDPTHISTSRQETIPVNSRQFPITELSSPVMIRKIARNAQNSSNYIGSYDRNMQPNANSLSRDNKSKTMTSPYENVSIQHQGIIINGGNQNTNYIPKSPNSNSPRTRIKTTYAHRNITQPQYFIFPSPPPLEKNAVPKIGINKCPGIEKQLSLTEDIPMIDDTDFANELEMRIAQLKPENREKAKESLETFIIEPLDHIFNGQRRDLEEIKRDLIADIPEIDALQEDLDRNINNSSKRYNLNENLQNLSDTLQNLNVDDSFLKNSSKPYATQKESVRSKNINAEFHVNEIVSCLKERDSVYEINQNNEAKINDDESMLAKYDSSYEKNQSFKETLSSEPNNKQNNNLHENLDLDELEKENESLNLLENLYTLRKKIMNEMKERKTEIHDLELSRKQNQMELDDFEIRMEVLQDEIQIQHQLRQDEIETAIVTDIEKLKFKTAQEERQVEMKEMQKKLEHAEMHVRRIEKSFTKGEATLEELRHAQELLENEKKLFEDMEFQHLEKESEFYSRLSREQNIIQNDPCGRGRNIERMERLMQDLDFEFNSSENRKADNDESENPHLRNLLDHLTSLERELGKVNSQINTIKREAGIYRINERNSDIDNHKARIKSGDFSPPTSDDDDMDEIKDRIRSQGDGMSNEISVEIQKSNPAPENILQENKAVENESYQNIDSEIMNQNKYKNTIDQMSMSMFVETASDLQEMFNDSTVDQNLVSPKKIDTLETIEPNNSEKKGFWERNFDSLSRLKSKDKKSKTKTQDLMSQSFNENMFYNNENIESEYGSFETCNSLKSNSKNKDLPKSKSDEPNKSKIASLSSLGKIIRRDSLGKKNKDSSKRIIDDKENVDINAEIAEKTEESLKECEQKNAKPRYLKNSKSICSDNKYTNKSKIMQIHNTSPDMKHSKENLNASNPSIDEKRYSYPDSLEDVDNHLLFNSKTIFDANSKIAFRKSAGDEIKKNFIEPGSILSDNTKVPSQDDIDRISKVTLDAPLLSSSGDMNTLGRKTLDSLRELERNRVAMLEEKGCQLIEDEREKILELKKRVQNETLLKWEENQLKTARNDTSLTDNEVHSTDQNSTKPIESDSFSKIKKTADDDYSFENYKERFDDKSIGIDFDSSSVIIEDGALENSILEKQLRNSHSDSYNSSAYIEDERGGSRNDRQSSPLSNYPLTPSGNATNNGIRPLSEMSDMSSDNGVPMPLVEGPRRSRKVSSNSLNNSFGTGRNREDTQRPLTRYLPIDKEDLNLRQHIESAGHQVDLCPHITIDSTSCRGYLHKLGAKFHGWSKRWFVFDRTTKTLIYYSDKNEKKPRGGAYFQVIEEVYLDHLNVSKSPTPLTTFVIKTRQRKYYLMAPSGPAARIWIDVIFTGAQGYTEYMQ